MELGDIYLLLEGVMEKTEAKKRVVWTRPEIMGAGNMTTGRGNLPGSEFFTRLMFVLEKYNFF